MATAVKKQAVRAVPARADRSRRLKEESFMKISGLEAEGASGEGRGGLLNRVGSQRMEGMFWRRRCGGIARGCRAEVICNTR
jgi:hypothetical protein